MRVFICLLLVGLFACAPTTNLPTAKQQQADADYRMAMSHLQSNNPIMALKKLLSAAALDPSNSAIHVGLAQAYQQKRSYANAERHYLKALELSADDPRYLNNLASLYLDMQQWDKAIEYFDKAAADLLFLSPHVAMTGKGFALFSKKDYTAALNQYDEVLAIAPGYARAYYLKSQVYNQMDNPEQSRQALERALSLAPDYAQANYQLGILFLKEKNHEAAAARLTRVVELAPNAEIGLKAAEMLQGLQRQ